MYQRCSKVVFWTGTKVLAKPIWTLSTHQLYLFVWHRKREIRGEASKDAALSSFEVIQVQLLLSSYFCISGATNCIKRTQWNCFLLLLFLLFYILVNILCSRYNQRYGLSCSCSEILKCVVRFVSHMQIFKPYFYSGWASNSPQLAVIPLYHSSDGLYCSGEWTR